MSSLKRPPSKEKETPPRPAGRENQEGKRSVDFALDYFTSNDPAESKLLSSLEENADSFSSSKPKSARGHRRKASKLQHLVKQISSRRHLRDDSTESHPAALQTIGRTNSAQSDAGSYHSMARGPSKISNGGTPGKPSILRKRAASTSNADTNPSRQQQQPQQPRQRHASHKRPSLPARDIRVPTSEYLSELQEKFDDTRESEEESEEEEAAGPAPAKSPRARHRRLKTNTDALYDPHAQHLEALFQIGPQDTYDDIAAFNRRATEDRSVSTAFSDLSEEDEDNDDDDDGDIEGGPNSSTPLVRRRRHAQSQKPNIFTKAYAYLLACFSILGPSDIWNGIVFFFLYRFLMIVVPILSVAALLFYGFDNPDFHFLPSDAHMSWWLIFLARLILTFNLAEATQYLLEIITTRTAIIVRMAGPFVALIAMQSLGWPFLLSSWGTWSLILMRGDRPFVRNWIHFFHIDMRMFNVEYNPDGGVLDSSLYFRIIMSMIFVGIATAAKRTLVALYLSRRMLQYYRKHLRELLAEMKLIMEVAELAAETETEEFARLIREETMSLRSGDTSQMQGSAVADVALNTLKATASKIMAEKVPSFQGPSRDGIDDDGSDHDEDDESIISDAEDETSMEVNAASTPTSNRSAFTKRSFPEKGSVSSSFKGSVQWSELKSQVKPKASGATKRATSPIEMAASAGEIQRSHRSTATSRGAESFMAMMDRWEEPETKSKKVLPSLYDILQFRKAMEFMENPYPFSSAFGLARTRKECIRSSARMYRRLLRFTPGVSTLHFDVIGALAYDDDGELDEKRAQSLLKIFQPDKNDLLPQLSFLQSVDYVYKQLRFLRASILNSSKIDSVLEDVFDVIFYGILAILVMTLLGLNPWPLLVSFSTVMVSFAFSFGPSCAKYIEGTLMIAVRRPYDIGDRITIISGESLTQPSSSADTWLVEDISLTTTTLRFAATNEVSTVNNAAIANSRIVNGARSSKAIVTINVKFNINATQEQVEIFRIRVENFLIDRPEIWAGLVHFRNDEVDHNMSFARYLMRVQHKMSWQEMPPIMVHRGELERYTNRVAEDLGIAWLSTHHRIRIMEVPKLDVKSIEGEDGSGQEDTGPKEEPFMKFLKAETGTVY